MLSPERVVPAETPMSPCPRAGIRLDTAGSGWFRNGPATGHGQAPQGHGGSTGKMVPGSEGEESSGSHSSASTEVRGGSAHDHCCSASSFTAPLQVPARLQS